MNNWSSPGRGGPWCLLGWTHPRGGEKEVERAPEPRRQAGEEKCKMATTTPFLLVVSSCNGCRPSSYPHRHRRFPGDPKAPNALPPLPSLRAIPAAAPLVPLPRRRRSVSAAYGDDDMDDDFGDFDADDADGVGEDDDIDNEQDYDVDYDRLLAPVKPPLPPSSSLHGEEGDIAMVAAESFVSTQESASDTVVDYAVDEDEFHKIRLLHCDFLIRKVPDPDDDVFDFREMYVTPPDTDIYSIPRVLAPMPQKYVRCTKKDFGRYNVTEPPVEHLHDPLYKTEREIMKVFLTKHYRNRRADDRIFSLILRRFMLLIRKQGQSQERKLWLVSLKERKETGETTCY
ncbi:unnamed protein product [Urochloa decumbens]|uniref:Uncharacterized protein n=1 Tax=Urochloa decumbens TaxID=240449 RepID=A0ABC9HF47_9POAL